MAHCRGAVGALALSHHPAGSRKAEGDFRQRMPGALLYGSLSRNPHSPLPGCSGGRWAFPYRLTGSGEAERAFPSAHAGSAALWLSVPETVQPIAGVLWGYGRFRIMPPGMEAMP